MDKRKIVKNFEGLYALRSQYADVLKKFNIENYQRLTENLMKVSSASATVDDIMQRHTNLLESLNVSISKMPMAKEMISKQWDALAAISNSLQTSEIIKLKEALINNDFDALQIFADSLQTTHIEAPNIALLKIIYDRDSVILPKGLSAVVSNLNKKSAQRLSCAENISFDIKSKQFYVESSPENRASISETNIVCSSLELLSGLDESDLITFMNELEEYPNQASEHATGKKIKEAILEWDTCIDFDCEYYYHARSLKEGQCPYTNKELRRAPNEVTWHGRYNYIGQSHYYFSDMPKGAVLEVRKHSQDSRVQVAKLKPIKSIRMIDLSHETASKNKFLEYCRFAPELEEYPLVKKEYLIPCYVASCCKKQGIEGIKYYGSKEYKNYVSWDDTYFDIVDSEIINK